jgi:hypothetical protein
VTDVFNTLLRLVVVAWDQDISITMNMRGNYARFVAHIIDRLNPGQTGLAPTTPSAPPTPKSRSRSSKKKGAKPKN